MLTADTESTVNRLTVQIDVESVVVRLALNYIADEQGWSVCLNHSAAGVRVSDRCHPSSPVDVLVSRDTPSDCQDALDAILQGAARSIVLWDEPVSLASAIDALTRRATMIPHRVIELAQAAPRLTARHRQTLQLLATGRSNAGISSVLHQSPSTTKRDIAELVELFDASNRASLTAAANRLGFLNGLRP